jgi:ubiquinone/menaquinone biosynthesis C-methylase UbiE
MAKKYTVLETDIVNIAKPVESNSAEQTFDRIEKQGGGKLPVIDRPIEYGLEEHFYDEARIRDFVVHMGAADEVLDIGPGDGWPLLRLAPFFRSVTGVEASQRRVDRITENVAKLGLKNVNIKKGSATGLEFSDDRFGGAVASRSIEQTTDPYKALREVFRVLRPGARLRIEFEAFEEEERGFSEGMMLTETEESLGYHYWIKHHRPAWERNYLIKFAPTPEMKEAFAKLRELVERLGQNPSANPEIGGQFIKNNQAAIAGASFYELEHFTSQSMKETLEEVGFVNVRVCWSAATLARAMWPRVKETGLADNQAQAICSGLADLSVRLEAPVGLGEPLVATKPA